MAQTTGLIEPHGGTLINRFANDPAALRGEAANLTAVPLTAGDVSFVHRVADGTLSPLTGPMNEDVFNHVLDTWTIEHNGQKLAWTIPLALPVTADLAGKIKAGDKVALNGPDGELVATLDVQSVFAWDKPRYIKSVYGTDRTDHPGADIALKNNADRTHLLGGELSVMPYEVHAEFGEHIKQPHEIRELLDKQGWDAVVAFQTRNPLHRAHEYALLYGLEELLRQGHNAGAVLNPLLGETKSDDVSAKVRMETYERLIESGEFGEGDKDDQLWQKVEGDVKDRVLLLGLDISMFYGGPAEAVMHAIYRQNMGFTNIIIGRKHADAPFHDGEAIWGDFDAQEVFDKLDGELKIQPVKVGFAAFYESLGRVDLMNRHPDEKPVFISGKEVRRMLKAGQQVDPRIMRQARARSSPPR